MPVHGGQDPRPRTQERRASNASSRSRAANIMPLYGRLHRRGHQDRRRASRAGRRARGDAWAALQPGQDRASPRSPRALASPTVSPASPTAWRANSPILVIGGQGPFANLRRGSLQEMDHVNLMRPITKWVDACYQTHRIAEYAELGIRHAVSGIPGPAFSRSRWTCSWEAANGSRRWCRRSAPARRASRPIAPTCARRWNCCATPTPDADGGTSVKWSMASPSMNAFLDETQMPGYTNGMGRGTNPPNSPQFLNRSRARR